MIKRTNMRGRCFEALSFAIGCLLVLSIGCAAGNPDGRIPVSGTVTWKGEPVQTGYIKFVATSGGKSSGGQIVDGSFELATNKGVPNGSYKVKITANRPSGKKIPNSDFPDQLEDEIEQYIPRRYNDKTELVLEVDGPVDPLAYDLKAK